MHNAENFSFQGMQFRPRCGQFNQDSFQRKLSVKIKCTIFAFYFNHSFFKYLCGKASKDNFTDRLSALVERVKMNAQWRHRYMTWEQEMRIQAEERAQELAPVMAQELAKNLVKEEVEEKTRETARKMLSKNIPEDVVAEYTGLKLSDVNKLLKG